MFSKEKIITVGADYFRSNKNEVYSSREFNNEKGEACLVEVLYDNDNPSPRVDYDNLWKWVTTKRAGYSDIDYYRKENNRRIPVYYDIENFEPNELSETALVISLHLYRHSGDFISVGVRSTAVNGNCRWDGGVMGFAFVSFEELKKEYKSENISEDIIRLAMDNLKGEVEAINMFNSGQVYGFRIVNMVTEEENSVWGNYAGHT
jgi:hypothetical protein